MNTNNLAKFYDQLTPHERYPMILAASARDDAVEKQRLLDSAPRIQFQVPHHYGLVDALCKAADFHLLNLLNLAAKYWHYWGLSGWQYFHSPPNQGKTGARERRTAAAAKSAAVRSYRLAGYEAFLFITYVDGWQQFCAELSIDAAVLLDVLPGWEMITRTEKHVRKQAYVRDEVLLFLRSEQRRAHGTPFENRELPPLPTVAGLAKDWHDFLDSEGAGLSGKT